MIKNSILIILSIFCFGCNFSKKQSLSTFQIPELYNSQVLDSLGINRPNTILGGEFPIYGGTYHFLENPIDINPDSVMSRNKRNKVLGIEYISKYLNRDTLEVLKQNYGTPSLIVDYDSDLVVKSLGSTTVYPVYLVNNTNNNLIISSHSSSSNLNREFYSESLMKWTGYSTVDTIEWNWNCGCCTSYYFLKPNHFSIYLFDKSKKGQKHKMKITHSDGFESEEYYGFYDTTSHIKIIQSDGTIGLMDSTLYHKYFQEYFNLIDL